MTVFPHDLKVGAGVYSSDGHKLGELHRLVLRRADLSLSHVVIDIGLLRAGHHFWEGGLGLDYDRVVPVAQVSSAEGDRINLGLTAAEFKDAPEYTEESFEAPVDVSPNEFDLPDVVNVGQQMAGALNSIGAGAWIVEKLNRPLDSVDISEGTPVWRPEPHTKVGDVKRVLLDDSGRLQALVVERGFLLTRDVILPVRYISEVLDDLSVHVEISNEDLAKLQEYKD